MRRTDTTLLEQMHITDTEISQRMELLNLSQEGLKLLSSHSHIIEDNIDVIVNEFYKKQTEIDEISLLIGDAGTLMRLRSAQRKYVIDMFSGEYGSEYVNNRLRIGLVHKRIGVESKLYLSAVKSLKELVTRTLKNNIKNVDLLNSTLNVLESLFYFDTTLVFDTYIASLVEEIESEKRKTEIYAESLEGKVAERTKQLEELAKLDALTGIHNRRAMVDILNRELSISRRRESKLSLVYLDIDNFKKINDQQGHVKGDEILKYTSHILKSCVRDIDVACRYGGDEFCLVLPDCSIEDANNICLRIIEKFTSSYPNYSLSIGITEIVPGEIIEIDELIKKADKNMYIAKKQEGSIICA
ncbi:MAG: GGDEF domain-containing protein [Candidatus Thiodiazotropha sp. 6PDIVS]